MTRSAFEIIWGYNDTILADVVDATISDLNNYTKECCPDLAQKLHMPWPTLPTLVQVQPNNSAEVREQPSEIYTGVVSTPWFTSAHHCAHSHPASTLLRPGLRRTCSCRE
jgi:hypothetical protein